MTSSFAPDATVAMTPGLALADLGAEAVILDPASGLYFGLNQVAARILELVWEPLAVSQIKETLADEYDVDRDRLYEDINGFLNTLASRGLIHVDG